MAHPWSRTRCLFQNRLRVAPRGPICVNTWRRPPRPGTTATQPRITPDSGPFPGRLTCRKRTAKTRKSFSTSVTYRHRGSTKGDCVAAATYSCRGGPYKEPKPAEAPNAPQVRQRHVHPAPGAQPRLMSAHLKAKRTRTVRCIAQAAPKGPLNSTFFASVGVFTGR